MEFPLLNAPHVSDGMRVAGSKDIMLLSASAENVSSLLSMTFWLLSYGFKL